MGWRVDDSQILTKEQIAAGYYIDDEEDCMLVRDKNGKQVARFFHGTSPDNIQSVVYDEMSGTETAKN